MTLPGRVVSTHLYRIGFLVDGPHLRASITGYVGSLETAVATWRAIADEVQALGSRSLLVVDQREGAPLPEEQTAQLLDAIREFGLAQLRLAYVETRMAQFSRAEAMEIVACEKGFDIRVFGNEMEAALWLRHGELPSSDARHG